MKNLTNKYIDRRVIITVRDYFKENVDFEEMNRSDLINEDYSEEDGFLERHFLTDDNHMKDFLDAGGYPVVFINNGYTK